MRNMKFLQKVGNLLLFCPIIHVHIFQDGHDIFLHRKVAENRSLLGQIADAQACPLVHRHAADIDIGNQHLPGSWPLKAYNHVKGSSLAGTIRPQQTHNLPLFYTQGYAVYYIALLKGFN